MADGLEGYDPESPEQREIAGAAARDESDFFTLMGHAYRGEVGRMTAWRTRIDRTTNWAVVLAATLLTWTFSSESRPHYILLVGLVMVTVFLSIEARRYRIYDVWRSRVRLLEENVFANALEPNGAQQENWRHLLSDDLREPTLKTPVAEAVSRRLRRVYFPLLAVLTGAWVVRITVFAPPGTSVVETAAVGGVPGEFVLALVSVFALAVLALTLWPRSRQAKGTLRTQADTDDWR